MRRSILLFAGLYLLIDGFALSQTSSTPSEFWPKLSATVELGPKTRIQLWGQRQDGEDFDFNEW